MTEENNSIKDNIIKSIEGGQVTMKPKWHFVLRTILLLLGLVLAALVLLYTISFIIFVLHQTGAWFVPGFGIHGLTEFLMSFPWLIVLVAALFIAILELLVRQYAFGYRKPLLYTTIGVIFLTVGGGFVVAGTSFHRGLFDQANQDHLPVAGGFYKMYGRPHRDNVAIGAITQIIDDDGYMIEDRRDQLFQIIFDTSTDFPDGRDFKIGDSIVIFGNHNTDNSIQALGIRKIEDTEPPPPPHGNLIPAMQ
jgi:hypothetical protein